MSLSKSLFLLVLLVSGIGSAHAADAARCDQAMAMKAEEAASPIKDWDQLYSAYKSYAVCDSGAIAEGFSDSVAKLFADHWDEIGKFVSYAEKDEDFKYFAIGYLDETDAAADLDKTAANAKSRCPNGQDKLCAEIFYQTKYPDVNGWLGLYAAKQKSSDGGSVGYYPEYNAYISGDLSGNGTENLVVAYTLEGVRGGTDWLRYVAVFTKSTDKDNPGYDYCCSYQIGGKGIGTEDRIEIKNGEIVVTGKAFVDGKDAYCCPSMPELIRLKLLDDKLIEIKKSTVKK